MQNNNKRINLQLLHSMYFECINNTYFMNPKFFQGNKSQATCKSNIFFVINGDR